MDAVVRSRRVVVDTVVLCEIDLQDSCHRYECPVTVCFEIVVSLNAGMERIYRMADAPKIKRTRFVLPSFGAFAGRKAQKTPPKRGSKGEKR